MSFKKSKNKASLRKASFIKILSLSLCFLFCFSFMNFSYLSKSDESSFAFSDATRRWYSVDIVSLLPNVSSSSYDKMVSFRNISNLITDYDNSKEYLYVSFNCSYYYYDNDDIRKKATTDLFLINDARHINSYYDSNNISFAIKYTDYAGVESDMLRIEMNLGSSNVTFDCFSSFVLNYFVFDVPDDSAIDEAYNNGYEAGKESVDITSDNDLILDDFCSESFKSNTIESSDTVSIMSLWVPTISDYSFNFSNEINNYVDFGFKVSLSGVVIGLNGSDEQINLISSDESVICDLDSFNDNGNLTGVYFTAFDEDYLTICFDSPTYLYNGVNYSIDYFSFDSVSLIYYSYLEDAVDEAYNRGYDNGKESVDITSDNNEVIDEFIVDNLVSKDFVCFNNGSSGYLSGTLLNSNNICVSSDVIPFVSNYYVIDSINIYGYAYSTEHSVMGGISVIDLVLGNVNFDRFLKSENQSDLCDIINLSISEDNRLVVELLSTDFYQYDAINDYYYNFNGFNIDKIIVNYRDLGYSQDDYLMYGESQYNNGFESGKESVDLTIDNDDAINDYIINNNYHSDDDYIDYGNLKYNSGYSTGYDKGETDTQNAKGYFSGLVFSIFDAPFNVLSEAFDFEIFGINIGNFLIVIVSLLLVAFVLKKFL